MRCAWAQWHLGFRTAAHLPTSRGFDTHFGLLSGGTDHFNKASGSCGGKLHDGSDWRCWCAINYTLPHSSAMPFRIDYWDGRAPAKELWDETTYDAYLYSERMAQLVDRHDTAAPFFLYWAPHKVHNPLQVDERFLSPYPADAGGVCASTPETCAARGYIGKHVKKGDGPPDLMEGCGCSLTCYCNRRILKGMISVVDEMMANLTTSLERRGMWDSTVVILIGDNGAPVSTAGSNSIFKGHKFSHWEGGHRVPSFIGGPAVSESLAGKVYKGTVHLVDLHRTILDLAGVAAPAQPSGVKPHDGVSLVGVLEGRVALDTPVRSELWIADSVLRVGAYKVSQVSAMCSALSLFPVLIPWLGGS